MRNINVPFTDEELERLAETKGDRTWREAILDEFDAAE